MSFLPLKHKFKVVGILLLLIWTEEVGERGPITYKLQNVCLITLVTNVALIEHTEKKNYILAAISSVRKGIHYSLS